ncbi:class I SAM-dependent methyltransferase [Magnetovibrio sp. PR-2]|uniref:class I SAM-dependent DNA methyltransferase n=1 Tax=Magnetovibrio sp. PR-2 TaxID=3120356 RepID=UPI002FCE070E
MSDAVFNLYADYYDLIYADKNYQQEADKVAGLLSKYGVTQDGTVLELGCGTARHALALAQKGYNLIATDLSAEMLKHAENRVAHYPDLTSRIELDQGNAQSYRLGRTVDAVISLFHVMCYQTTDQALMDSAKTAAEHLKPGGVLVFDMWNSPAVLNDPPTLRVKRVQDEKLEVVRIAEPGFCENSNIVDVNYQIFVKRPDEELWQMLDETHSVRHLSETDLRPPLEAAGFDVLGFYDWDTDEAANDYGWNAYCVAVKK